MSEVWKILPCTFFKRKKEQIIVYDYNKIYMYEIFTQWWKIGTYLSILVTTC